MLKKEKEKEGMKRREEGEFVKSKKQFERIEDRLMCKEREK